MEHERLVFQVILDFLESMQVHMYSSLCSFSIECFRDQQRYLCFGPTFVGIQVALGQGCATCAPRADPATEGVISGPRSKLKKIQETSPE